MHITGVLFLKSVKRCNGEMHEHFHLDSVKSKKKTTTNNEKFLICAIKETSWNQSFNELNAKSVLQQDVTRIISIRCRQINIKEFQAVEIF